MYCYTYNCNKPKAFSQYFWATYFHPKEKGRVMCALQYLHVSISNYTKAVLGTSFRCLCLSLPQIMHISFLFIFDAVYLGMERISTSSFFSPFSFVQPSSFAYPYVTSQDDKQKFLLTMLHFNYFQLICIPFDLIRQTVG